MQHIFAFDAVYALPLAQELGVPLVTTFHGINATASPKIFVQTCAVYLIPFILLSLLYLSGAKSLENNVYLVSGVILLTLAGGMITLRGKFFPK